MNSPTVSYWIESPVSNAAVGTAPKECQCKAFNRKVSLQTNGSKLVRWKSNVDFNKTMALDTGQVLMHGIVADMVTVRSISKIDAIEQPFVDQDLNRPLSKPLLQIIDPRNKVKS